MALITPADITSQTNYETFLNSTTLLQPRNLCCMREARNLSKKKLLQAHVFLKLKKKVMSQTKNTTPCHGVCSKKVIAAPVEMPTTSVVTSYPYQQDIPLAVNDWHPMNTPLFTIQPLPVVIPSPSTIFAAHICPFGGTMVQPVISPIVPQTFVQDNVTDVSNYINEYNISTEQVDGVIDAANEKTCYIQEKNATEFELTQLNNEKEKINVRNLETQGDPLEAYLSLPKELFPTARMLTVDPNALIDEFCKMPNMQRHAPWILDLEFGIPRTLITRPLPTYNVKFNSIHCKNTPDAIHPGFESCTPEFKRALLFYYDCIVSAWYRGYTMATCDRSVENFQSWLLIPMQVLGMCWP